MSRKPKDNCQKAALDTQRSSSIVLMINRNESTLCYDWIQPKYLAQ